MDNKCVSDTGRLGQPPKNPWSRSGIVPSHVSRSSIVANSRYTMGNLVARLMSEGEWGRRRAMDIEPGIEEPRERVRRRAWRLGRSCTP